MAHYAFLDENNIVVEVITGQDEGQGGMDWEEFYQNLRGLRCKRTSYNTRENYHINGYPPFRKNYAGIGFKYDEELDAFIPPKPYDSWILNEDLGIWQAPTPIPDEFNLYEWIEETQTWVLRQS